MTRKLGAEFRVSLKNYHFSVDVKVLKATQVAENMENKWSLAGEIFNRGNIIHEKYLY